MSDERTATRSPDHVQLVKVASRSFQEKLAAFHLADSAEAAFDEAVYCPARDAYLAAVDKLAHEVVGPDPDSGSLRSVSTADMRQVASARRLIREISEGRCRLDPLPSLEAYLSWCKRLVRAADRRDLKVGEIVHQLRVDEYEAHSDQLTDATNTAFQAVICHPIDNPADLAAKLELVDASNGHDRTDVWEAIIADARRLAASGAG